ncbi:GNAT family N-acetyltransferase [Nocardioides bizhenqiangii]|uniref:GNAT family N-acetyltransferase n=1 Tax=Nocardioides bizhenqiangii TaxID=3095076 RepID=A0ABZ0ZT51_9ACTN|nr:GNAT family N-acetyltransferase [Nocardioides sp. HM61]WQQ27096.1 GNAT family N-acetyltransferase [Nocardioides sp. HM61]
MDVGDRIAVSDGAAPVLTTERLRLEPVGDHHLEFLVELNADAEVMRYICGRGRTAAETADEWLLRRGPQSDVARGLGYWAGFTDAGFVGWWSASSFTGRPDLAGLGYRLRRAAWGTGLATEGARAMVAYAFTVPGVERVVASTMAVNAASRRVLEKAGLRHVDTIYEEWRDPLPGSELGEVVYEILRPGGPGPDPSR